MEDPKDMRRLKIAPRVVGSTCLAVLFAASAGTGSQAVDTTDYPDWPCAQRKVVTLTSVQIWDGPPTEEIKGWKDDKQIKELTPILVSRRVPLKEAEKAIKTFADSQTADQRDEKLTLLFASVLSSINRDRKFVLGRIETSQKRQKKSALQIEGEGKDLAQTQSGEVRLIIPGKPTSAGEGQYNWNARIFREREEALTMACEIPVLIEQRAYEIAKLIRAQMKS